MISKLLVIIALVISLFTGSLAEDIANLSSEGTGCTASLGATSTGFNAQIFYYSPVMHLYFDDDNWVANSATTGIQVYSTSQVDDPNFDLLVGVIQPLYGYSNYDLNGLTVQLTGYFVGTYYIFKTFLYCPFTF